MPDPMTCADLTDQARPPALPDPPARDVRVVASDLDGTLVRADLTVTARTVRTLHRVRDAGVRVVLVTGRPVRWMPPVVQATGLDGVAICSNGAVVYDLGTEQVLHTHGLPPAAVTGVVERLRALWPQAVFALETPGGIRCLPGFVPRVEAGTQVPVAPLPELLADDACVVKVLCRVPGGRADDLLGPACTAVGDLAEVVHSNPDDSMLELGPARVSKASTLAGLTAGWGVTPQGVVAFGDMPNDVPMLRWAGAAYAMAGGAPEAAAAAGRTAPPCDDDGVAQVLERIFGW